MSNPIKPTFKSEVVPITLILISFIASIYFYSNFPESVPNHWNYKGEIDGWSSKGFGAFFLPSINLGFYLLLMFLPMIDPKRNRYVQFAKPYHVIKAAYVAFMTLVYLYTGLIGLGYKVVSMNIILPIALGVLFIILGNYLGKVKSNWFVGIRTPWTLSNEEVWNKTHRLSGKIFVLFGLILIFCAFLPLILFWAILIVSALFVVLVPIIYSYLLYRKLAK